jgi:SNF2 family DNA or RNA helicase
MYVKSKVCCHRIERKYEKFSGIFLTRQLRDLPSLSLEGKETIKVTFNKTLPKWKDCLFLDWANNKKMSCTTELFVSVYCQIYQWI